MIAAESSISSARKQGLRIQGQPVQFAAKALYPLPCRRMTPTEGLPRATQAGLCSAWLLDLLVKLLPARFASQVQEDIGYFRSGTFNRVTGVKLQQPESS